MIDINALAAKKKKLQKFLELLCSQKCRNHSMTKVSSFLCIAITKEKFYRSYDRNQILNKYTRKGEVQYSSAIQKSAGKLL